MEMGLLFRGIVDSLYIAAFFYALLLLGAALGLRGISEESFNVLSPFITALTFSFSILNIRLK